MINAIIIFKTVHRVHIYILGMDSILNLKSGVSPKFPTHLISCSLQSSFICTCKSVHLDLVMSVSLEALAMAGVNYLESGMDIEEWERQDLGPPPSHLLAEEEEEEEEEKGMFQEKNHEHGDTNEKTRIARPVRSIGRTYLRVIISVLVMMRIDITNKCTKASSPPF